MKTTNIIVGIIVAVAAAVLAAVFFFVPTRIAPNGSGATVPVMSALQLTSSAFKYNEEIPSLYTCDGEDKNPPLKIEGVPEGAESLVLIVDDPDASVGVWGHWIVFNVSPDTKIIAEATEPRGVGGNSSWGRTGYGGPCPPDGEHRYFFKLYALDIELDLSEGATKQEVEQAMKGHVISQTELVGLYKRQ